MPEQTFRSPNFYDREIVVLSSGLNSGPSGVPAGVIGTAKKGPAFVPVTVANFNDFTNIFGGLANASPASYAVNEWLKNRSALTFLRVLGGGSNSSLDDFNRTVQDGRVKNAGFRLYNDNKSGTVYFLLAEHEISSTCFRNGSYPFSRLGDENVRHVRAMIMVAKDWSLEVNDQYLTFAKTVDERVVQTKNVSYSLDPKKDNYISKVLNTDPERFEEFCHFLYADFPIDAEVASYISPKITTGKQNPDDALAGIPSVDDPNVDLTFKQAFGSFDTRYKSASTTWFISQPYGEVEYNLFKLESRTDGSSGNSQFKVAISDLRASTDPTNPYPTFTLQLRQWDDTDSNPKILESFSGCSLNPSSATYISRRIGDIKSTFDFDAEDETERRIITTGKYPNQSRYVRVIAHPDLEAGLVPASAMPFGFRGPELFVTNKFNESGIWSLPPVPFRFKITKSPTPTNAISWPGQAVINESTVADLCWGVKFEKDSNLSNPNMSTDQNLLIDNFSKFLGNRGLNVLVKEKSADDLNFNKFTLSRVALSVPYTDSEKLTSKTPAQYMKEAAYLRDKNPVLPDLTLLEKNSDSTNPVQRISLATILTNFDATVFNRFSQYAKFVTFLSGGWDGLNILNKNEAHMGDQATSIDLGGCAEQGFTSPGFNYSVSGETVANSSIMSYRTAINIMTDGSISRVNVLAIPGIRDSLVTDYASDQVREYGLGLYLMDIPSYDDMSVRIFDGSNSKPNVSNTIGSFESRKIDNNYVSAYFPDVVLDDPDNRRRVRVPSSVAALGALGFNDKVSYPWFAPAGFNRAALDFVTNVPLRLNVSDRDALYDARINPIASFPRLGFVIYGQKTLQIKKSSLDRVNVRRLLLEVKRVIKGIAQGLVFEQNTPEVRNKFVADASIQLSQIQAAAGVEAFQVVMNETNNPTFDSDRINGRVVVVPTRVIEYIAIDFIITNSGVQFV